MKNTANGDRMDLNLPTQWGRNGAAVHLTMSLESATSIPDRGAFRPAYVGRKPNDAALPPLDYAQGIVYFILDTKTNRIVYIGEAHTAKARAARRTLMRHFQGFAGLAAEGPDPARVRFRAGNATYRPSERYEVAWIPVPCGVAFMLQCLLIQRLKPCDNGTDHSHVTGDLSECPRNWPQSWRNR